MDRLAHGEDLSAQRREPPALAIPGQGPHRAGRDVFIWHERQQQAQQGDERGLNVVEATALALYALDLIQQLTHLGRGVGVEAGGPHVVAEGLRRDRLRLVAVQQQAVESPGQLIQQVVQGYVGGRDLHAGFGDTAAQGARAHDHQSSRTGRDLAVGGVHQGRALAEQHELQARVRHRLHDLVKHLCLNMDRPRRPLTDSLPAVREDSLHTSFSLICLCCAPHFGGTSPHKRGPIR
ncbi:hypothetical protein SDC9_76137 [bioreactor metagenome]|uniref:Uncharacterized protein n=1 Tax=bioreactor metagenome TaxID=1076179 RepID=A0A644YMS7_9ZZZZ